jgi:hypothetical protein
MKKHSHNFVEEYEDLVGVGLNRETYENTLIYLMQKFSDDGCMALLASRLTDEDITELVGVVYRVLKKHLSQEEYHRVFLKD